MKFILFSFFSFFVSNTSGFLGGCGSGFSETDDSKKCIGIVEGEGTNLDKKTNELCEFSNGKLLSVTDDSFKKYMQEIIQPCPNCRFCMKYSKSLFKKREYSRHLETLRTPPLGQDADRVIPNHVKDGYLNILLKVKKGATESWEFTSDLGADLDRYADDDKHRSSFYLTFRNDVPAIGVYNTVVYKKLSDILMSAEGPNIQYRGFNGQYKYKDDMEIRIVIGIKSSATGALEVEIPQLGVKQKITPKFEINFIKRVANGFELIDLHWTDGSCPMDYQKSVSCFLSWHMPLIPVYSCEKDLAYGVCIANSSDVSNYYIVVGLSATACFLSVFVILCNLRMKPHKVNQQKEKEIVE